MAREVPTLWVTLLKFIAKQPALCIDEPRIERALRICRDNDRGKLTQALVDYITEAGRLTDGVIPISLFDSSSVSLDLKNSKLSGVYLKQLVDRCSGLVSVNISGCFQVDDDVVAHILRKCPIISEIYIQNCRKITSRTLLDIASSGRNIIAIDVGGNTNITEEGLIQFLKMYRYTSTIRFLNLSGLELTGAVLSVIAERCSSVEVLGIAYVRAQEDNVRFIITALGRKLKKLNIAWAPCGDTSQNYPPEFFDILAQSCPQLTDLDVCGVRTVTAWSLQRYIDLRLAQVILAGTLCIF
jgi:hypothetical protein